MKKLLLVIGLLASLVVSQAATLTTTTTINGGSYALLSTALGTNQPAIVQTIRLTSAANNQAFASIYDSPVIPATNVIPAYIAVTSYVTNAIVLWTNYYGATNAWTNLSLVDITNTVSARTNTFPLIYQLTSGTNLTTTFTPLSTRFANGIAVTNSGAAAFTISIDYVQ